MGYSSSNYFVCIDDFILHLLLYRSKREYGGFIPGLRPGKPTTDYLDKIMSRITLAGAIFLALIALMPNVVGWITGIEGIYFGGYGPFDRSRCCIGYNETSRVFGFDASLAGLYEIGGRLECIFF